MDMGKEIWARLRGKARIGKGLEGLKIDTKTGRKSQEEKMRE